MTASRFQQKTTDQLLRDYRFHDSDRGTMTYAQEVRRMSLVDEIGAELQRRGVPLPEPAF